MERTGRTRPRSARLVVTPAALALVFGSIIAALVLRNVVVAARRPLGWAVASLVMAAAIEPAVTLFSRQMRRGLALVCVLVPLIGGIGFVAHGVYQDLDRSTVKLQRAIPQAASSIERDERLGPTARQLDLHDRAQEAADRLRKPSSKVAGKAVGSGGAWLVCTILTVFALAWGPRFAKGALAQVHDPARKERLASVVGDAFARSQAYMDAALLQGVGTGAVAWLVFRLFDVPAPTPLAVLVGVLSLVPVVGIVVGYLPAAMLVAGFDSFGKAGMLVVVAVALQVVQVLAFRGITRRTLYVGPAIMVIAFLVGNDLYGLGGAACLIAVSVFGIALVDANAEFTGTHDDLPPEEADPTEAPDTGGPEGEDVGGGDDGDRPRGDATDGADGDPALATET